MPLLPPSYPQIGAPFVVVIGAPARSRPRRLSVSWSLQACGRRRGTSPQLRIPGSQGARLRRRRPPGDESGPGMVQHGLEWKDRREGRCRPGEALGSQDSGAGVARAWRGRSAGYRQLSGLGGAGVAWACPVTLGPSARSLTYVQAARSQPPGLEAIERSESDLSKD
eukprot:gene16166-biopygen20248